MDSQRELVLASLNRDNQKDVTPVRPTWKCELCGRFYSERTAKRHGWCQQEMDRRDAESAWPAA